MITFSQEGAAKIKSKHFSEFGSQTTMLSSTKIGKYAQKFGWIGEIFTFSSRTGWMYLNYHGSCVVRVLGTRDT